LFFGKIIEDSARLCPADGMVAAVVKLTKMKETGVGDVIAAVTADLLDRPVNPARGRACETAPPTALGGRLRPQVAITAAAARLKGDRAVKRARDDEARAAMASRHSPAASPCREKVAAGSGRPPPGGSKDPVWREERVGAARGSPAHGTSAVERPHCPPQPAAQCQQLFVVSIWS
jgi:hypothetical protein